MSAPSPLHEQRVRMLETVAVLSGVPIPAKLGADCIPDVARISADGGVVLVADAKASEAPGGTATLTRLLRYLRAVRPLVEAGIVVRFAVCHGDSGRAQVWERQLGRLVAFAGLASAAASATTYGIDRATFVTSIDLHREGASRRRSRRDTADGLLL